MHCAPVSQSYNWKQIHRSGLIKTWLLGLLSLWGCFQGSLVRENNGITSSSKIRPIDVDTSIAEEIGQEALREIGYNEIIRLSEKAGFVEYKMNMSIQLVSYGLIDASGFAPVFSRYALTAAVTSQADSPLPGPADLAALGVVVIGLIDAGLLDGYLLNTAGAWLASTSDKLLMSKATTNDPRGTGGTSEAAGAGNAGGGTATAAESAGTADATGAEAGTQEPGPGGWNKGSYSSAAESLKAHFEKHGPEVGAQTVEQYLNKARGFANNLRGAQRFPIKGATEGVVRYVKNERYIDLAPDKSIISFGAR